MKALDFLELNEFDFHSLKRFSPPAAAKNNWNNLCQLLNQFQSEKTSWPAQIELAKDFYLPLMQDNYEADYVRSGDIEQLCNIAQQYLSSESFISELTFAAPNSNITADVQSKIRNIWSTE